MNLQPTPLEEYPALAKAAGVGKLYIKREDFNLSGSHKDRGLWPYGGEMSARGEREFCLSSSGNLAVSATYYAKQNPEVTFHLFLPSTLSDSKRERFNSVTVQQCDNVHLYWSKTPKTDAVRFSREKKVKLLRGSTDDGFLEGYHQLAQELTEQINENIGSVFMAISSGTMAVGLWKGFLPLKTDNLKLPQLHIVQTTKVHPIASEFDKDFVPTKTSLASAIVDRVAHRKKHVMQAVEESGGFGWVVGDKEIEATVHTLEKLVGGTVSPESAISLAGLEKALRKGFQVTKPAVLVFTGK